MTEPLDLDYLRAHPELLLLRVRTGSHAYGLATETSDEDFRGVYFPPYEYLLAGDYPAQIADATNDEVYYEVGRFFELLQKSNPTVLEMLATVGEDRLVEHPLLRDVRVEDFLSKASARAFAGYAESQIRKARGLNKKVFRPVEKRLKSVEEFCYVLKDGGTIPLVEWLAEQGYAVERIGLASVNHTRGLFAMYYGTGADAGAWARGISSGERANQLRLSNVPEGTPLVGYLNFNPDAYSVYRREYREYWDWVADRNEVRYEGTLAHGGGYDAKNMMHTLRLLDLAIGIFETGRVNVRVADRAFLLRVKAGEFSLETVLGWAEEKLGRLRGVAGASELPEEVDSFTVRNQLLAIRRRLYA